MTHSPHLFRLPTEILLAIAGLLDMKSLLHFKLTCKRLVAIVENSVSLRYVLALAARGLCNGRPSSITVAARYELLKMYSEAWRMAEWTEHVTMDLPYPHEVPYVSGGMLVLPILGMGRIKSFAVQRIPSALRGITAQHWVIELDFFVAHFMLDAAQDLLAVVPQHDTRSILLRSLATGYPHPLSVNKAILRLEESQNASGGNSKQDVCGDYLGLMTWNGDRLDDRLAIWNWKTGERLVNMPMKLENIDDAIFSFIDDHHFVVPALSCESPGRYNPLGAPPVVRSYVLSVTDALSKIHTLRFFPDITARGGAPPLGHFHADPATRLFGIQVEAVAAATGRDTVQELLVPISALTRAGCALPRLRRATVRHEPVLGRSLAYAARATRLCHAGSLGAPDVCLQRAGLVHAGCCEGTSLPPEKLPAALRAVEAAQLRIAVCGGALLVFEHAKENGNLPRKLHILAF
ncbi:hypothetical protein BC834DRAFT_970540 [Gloeopeniophorella convolvens]|nr:hypothetical protein BC834DRAFT_970540 [Gloeopeniophorella convolvens]